MKHLFARAVVSLLVFSFLSFASAKAQSITSDDIKSQLVAEWERAKTYTVEYLNAMPPDKYSFKAVDSIRSFAQQMLHLAQANCGLMASAINQAPPDYAKGDLEHSAGAQTKDSVMYYVTNSYDFCINGIKNTDTKTWGATKEFFGRKSTVFALMLKTFEHQTHHRGQTTIYIRLQGIRPPGERLF